MPDGATPGRPMPGRPMPGEVTQFLTSRSPTTGRAAPRHARETVELLMADGFRVIRLDGCAWGWASAIELRDGTGVVVRLGHDRAPWECELGGPSAPVADVSVVRDAMTGERTVHRLADDPWHAPDPGDDWGAELPVLVPRLVAWLRSADRTPEVLDALAHSRAGSARAGRALLAREGVLAGPGPAAWPAPVGWPAPVPAAPLAGWGERVAASLVDSLVRGWPDLVALVVLVTTLEPRTLRLGDDSVTLPLPTAPGLVALLVAMVVGTAIGIWNRSFLQGRTGQSVGKRVVGIRLVAEATLAPPGPAQAFLRDLCHVLDAYSYVGYLWPLWDARRRTFADMIMRTVVLEAPRGAGRGGGPQSVPGGAPGG